MLEVRCRIEGKHFLVSAVGYEISLDTVQVGEDRRGPFALVNEGELVLSNGFKVRVEPPEERLPTGSVIAICFEAETREQAKEVRGGTRSDPLPRV